MEVRDPIHGFINIRPEIVPIVESPFFQRLRYIKQLGFSDHIFPGATHTRYIHSLGVMHTVGSVFDKIFHDNLEKLEFKKLKLTAQIAGLLHDIGHAPLSHSTESVMPSLDKLKLPEVFLKSEKDISRQANHEDYTIKIISDSSLTETLRKAQDSLGVTPLAISTLITGQDLNTQYFTVGGVNYFPILHQMISSELDCDRMDYLLRDSYFCGVSYGNFDLEWIKDHFQMSIINNEAFLGIKEKAINAFDDFLLSRFHMFLMVYFHHRAVCLEKMIQRFFSHPDSTYSIPSDIEEYLEHDDYYLQKFLKSSKDPWARRIIQNNVPQKIFETFGQSEQDKAEELKLFLDNNNIDYFLCESTGRLTKYSHETTPYPLKVVRKYSGKILNIHEATDLFDKYSKSHAVTRFHLDFDSLSDGTKMKLHDIIYS